MERNFSLPVISLNSQHKFESLVSENRYTKSSKVKLLTIPSAITSCTKKKLVAANYAGKLVKTVIRRNQKLIIGRGSFREKEKKYGSKIPAHLRQRVISKKDSGGVCRQTERVSGLSTDTSL